MLVVLAVEEAATEGGAIEETTGGIGGILSGAGAEEAGSGAGESLPLLATVEVD